ncbi:hypothetical protein [Stenotrophobium rhamnosiphilum]|uniref:Uncharacterized protein n=1 Tax=Stenotrophobium rhamnosiphilum TaxID=2029166 RepID=A0A2T5MBY3_9GAMM|nr:hypothetical protein [Stenotrophobium rhamnosiphilum]PTU30083.1 hypothetical protein CJD38_16175 [Stenotrophobium rhamnosiphilum]
MSIARVLLVLGLIGLGARWWTEYREERALAAVTSPNGFLPVPMPADTPQNTVLIFAPLNCPREHAQRARELAKKLTELGIQNIQTSHYPSVAFQPTEEKLASFKRLNVVMTGEIPIALVNGMGKANPSLDELVSEYKRTQ